MADISKTQKLPFSVFGPLKSQEQIVDLIAEVTGQSSDDVLERLRREIESPGYNVAGALNDAGIERYIWSDTLSKFYGQTDAFLYELVIWNLNRRKRKIRRWVARHLARIAGQKLNILSIGDGLGFDSAYLSMAGHTVTYFEFPGYSESFARRVFEQCVPEVAVLTDPEDIPQGHFDAVVCLDVLEHVPDPPNFVRELTGYLKPNGHLVSHAPFFMIHPSTPTHLKTNRRYCGSLSLYKQAGLHIVDGEPCWDPIILKKSEGRLAFKERFGLKMLGLKFSRLFLLPGRVSALPYFWVQLYRDKNNRWFGQS